MIDKISPDILLRQMEQMKAGMNETAGTEAPQKTEGPDFKEVLDQLISDVDTAQKEAEVSLKNLATGDTNSIQEVVMKMEEADVSFKLMKEIRDKLMQAYKDIMSMQA